MVNEKEKSESMQSERQRFEWYMGRMMDLSNVSREVAFDRVALGFCQGALRKVPESWRQPPASFAK
jgi:hypothetical protein